MGMNTLGSSGPAAALFPLPGLFAEAVAAQAPRLLPA